MKTILFNLVLLTLLSVNFQMFSQEDEVEQSNIQTYTPSKLLNNGQWDIKWGNNLYTQTKYADGDGNSQSQQRENFFTSTVEVFRGVSNNNRINVGAIIEFRSNTVGGRQALSVFSLDDTATDRKGFGSIAPAIKFQPISNIGNFSVTSAIHIPLVKNEIENGIFLDQSTWIFQFRF